MSRINICRACQFYGNGGRSRLPIPHTCGLSGPIVLRENKRPRLLIGGVVTVDKDSLKTDLDYRLNEALNDLKIFEDVITLEDIAKIAEKLTDHLIIEYSISK